MTSGTEETIRERLKLYKLRFLTQNHTGSDAWPFLFSEYLVIMDDLEEILSNNYIFKIKYASEMRNLIRF